MKATFCGMFGALLLVCSSAFAIAPPVSDAEKAACEIVADYLARGPAAVVERSRAGSPFASSNPNAPAEVEARLGPREGAFWELRTTSGDIARTGAVFYVVFPSGAEDVIAFTLSKASGTWMIEQIRTLAEVPDAGSAEPAQAAPAPPPVPQPRRLPPLVWLIFAAPLLSTAGAVIRRSHPHFASGALIAALVAFTLPIATIIDPDWQQRLRKQTRTTMQSLPSLRADAAKQEAAGPVGRLVQARRALAGGTAFPAAGARDGARAEIAALWKAQNDFGRLTPEEVKKELESLKVLRNAPLASLLRARLSAEEGSAEEARKEYAAARAQFVAHDAFNLEESLVKERPVDPAASHPLNPDPYSRDATLYYVKAVEHIASGDLDAARKTFREAWRIQPIPRAAVIDAGVFAFLLRDPSFSILLNMNAPEEIAIADLTLSRSPMQAPAGVRATACGTYVRLRIGEAQLDMPGSAAIAPRGTVAVTASQLDAEDSQEAIVRASRLSARSISSVAAQRIVEAAAEALAAHNQWDRILQLTDGITPESDNLPASLITWRARALLRAHRDGDAAALIAGRAFLHELQRSPDVGTMVEASGLLAQARAWPEAEQMLQQVANVKNAPDTGLALRKLQLERQLATSPPVLTTAHFEIHTTPDVPVTVAQRIGELLEAELQRVSARLHTGNFTPTRVNVLRWDDFSGQLTFSENVLGFYDGEITIPFGNVTRFRDAVVAILTHEMTHAVVAQATNDNAPRWFQEGLAQRMELVERQENVFQLKRSDPPLAMELLDSTMASVDPLAVGEAYVTALTVIRFLEDRYGAGVEERLMAEFRNGRDSDEAIRAITGKPMTQVDHEFRDWGMTHASAFLDSTPWPYIQYYSLAVDPSVSQNIRFSRPKKP